MLSEDVPVRLRLIAAQATGSDTAYPTLEEFSTALAYFERPDGVAVLRGLFERAILAPVRAVAAENELESPPVKPDEELQPRSNKKTHLRLVVGAAVTAACVLVTLLGASALDFNRAGATFMSFAGGVSTSTSRAISPAKAKDPVGTAGAAAAKSQTARPSGRTAERPTRAAATGTATAAVERSNNRRDPSSPKGRQEPLNVAAVFPINPTGTTLISAATESRPVFGEAVEIKATDEPGQAPPADAFSARIFSRGEEGVTPPRSVYPKLPSDSFSEEPDNRTVLELVIGTNGLVERAMLRSVPRDIHEFMLVSAAKAWIFEPATLEGLPVRYRHRVRISLP
jgi:hypothetical protein